MEQPATYQDWLADVQDAYMSACKRFRNGMFAIPDITELFKVSALIAAERRGITSPELVQQMSDHVVRQIESDLKIGADPAEFKFHFVISYIHSHTSAHLIDEMNADRIMNYVNDHWDLFDEEV